MTLARRLLPLLLLLPGAARAADAAVPPPRDEIVEIYEHRKIALTVPDGFALSREENQGGGVTVRLVRTKGALEIQLVFLPDPDGELAGSARARKEFMVRAFQEFVAQSAEQAMQFEELEPRVGAGTYCVFTDATLVGRPQLPAGEFLNVTAGVKAWRGGYVVFKLFSNDTLSAEYHALLKMLRESVTELPVSPLR